MRSPGRIGPIGIVCLAIILLAGCGYAPVDRSQGVTLLFEIQTTHSVSPEEESKLVSDTIKVLKQRLDPLAEFNFQFTKIGTRRIEIWFPDSAKTTPDEAARLATAAGVLNFRIAVDPVDLAKDPEALNAAQQSLAQNGPAHPLAALGTTLRWMQIAPQSRDNFQHGFVVQNWSGEPYVLCYDDQLHTLTHEPPCLPWSVIAGNPIGTKWGYVLPFTLDAAVGAKYMGQLTSDNLHHALAILLDDQAISAPTIRGRIEDKGEISFGKVRSLEETKKEANNLHRIMNAGALPARLTLVSPSSIAPSTLPAR